MANTTTQRRVPMDIVNRLAAVGQGPTAIQEAIRRETGEDFSLAAVSKARARATGESLQPRYTDLLPWRVRQEHLHLHYAMMLRALGAERAGRKIPHYRAVALRAFIRMLEDRQAVVHYDPATIEGFHLVPREAGDNDVIRKP